MVILFGYCRIIRSLEVGFGGRVEAASEQERGKGNSGAGEVSVMGTCAGDFERGEDVAALHFEQLVVFAMCLDKGGERGDQALVGAVILELLVRVVGDGLMQREATGAIDFQQTAVSERIKRFDGAGGNGQRGLFGEAVGPRRKDGERVESVAGLLRQLPVGESDDGAQGDRRVAGQARMALRWPT